MSMGLLYQACLTAVGHHDTGSTPTALLSSIIVDVYSLVLSDSTPSRPCRSMVRQQALVPLVLLSVKGTWLLVRAGVVMLGFIHMLCDAVGDLRWWF
ncbi:hypothetical protein COO60DRAFT_779966 [Scenedesmus sp. NREL 46B-D3]|nr:hypothetical protein COO60DRAFT_779966 [Scenedesmus sp. NREL 46B-D3]